MKQLQHDDTPMQSCTDAYDLVSATMFPKNGAVKTDRNMDNLETKQGRTHGDDAMEEESEIENGDPCQGHI